ncbi:MAG: histone deacetylase [Bacillota bacterium]
MKAAKHRTGLVFFPAFDWAITPDHPEREERLLYTRDQIREEGLLDVPGVVEYRPEPASELDIKRAHICVGSVSAVAGVPHLIAAGGTITAGEKVLSGEVDRAFALLRPPGHHAMRVVHGARGFCAINNEAVLAEYLRKRAGGKLRIAVIDTDAHHADGTQDIYYNDPEVLHISIHQDGRTLFPGSGHLTELGGPGAFAYTLNLPLPPGSGDRELLFAIEEFVLPVLRDYQPDIVINGAGQDNHYSDPLTNMNVSAQGYARLTELLAPDIVVLEGGYSIEGALPYVNVGIILALAGMDYSEVNEPDRSPERREADSAATVNANVRRYVEQLREIWEQRDSIDVERMFGGGDFYNRQRRIFYDTDNIVVSQEESFRLCSRCSGYQKVLSVAQPLHRARPTRVAAVIIPWHACRSCRSEAEEAFDSTSVSEFDYVYLQDVETDRYLTKERA